MVFLYTLSLNNMVAAPVEGLVQVPIALFIVVIYSVQFIEWVLPSIVYTDNVLDGIINKLQYSMILVKRAMHRVLLLTHTTKRH